jgi:hypothetical protein
LGVEHHVDAASAGDTRHFDLHIVGPVVDGMVETVPPEPVVLARTCGTDSDRTQVAGHLQRRQADSAACRVNEHGIAGVHRTQMVEHEVGGEERHRYPRRPHQVGAIVDLGHLTGRDDHHVGIAAEPGQGHHPVTDGQVDHPRTHDR